MMGVRYDQQKKPVPRAYHVPIFFDEGYRCTPAISVNIETWLDAPCIRLASGNTLSRRKLIRYMRDQDGGVHSDAALNQLYFDAKKALPIHPKSSVQIFEKNFLIGNLIENPALSAMRQIAHEFLSSLFSDVKLWPLGRARCRVFRYGDTGKIEGIFQPRGYNPNPIRPSGSLLIEY